MYFALHCRLKFPSVFIVYQTATLLLYEITVLVGRTDTDKLFCSSSDLEESFNNSTAFCTFSGTVTINGPSVSNQPAVNTVTSHSILQHKLVVVVAGVKLKHVRYAVY